MRSRFSHEETMNYLADTIDKQRRSFEDEIGSYLGIEFLSHPIFTRLDNVSFLGLVNYLMDIPTELRYTRYLHSLGVAHLTLRYCQNLSLPRKETLIALIAALLHDAGHGPFSHSSELILLWRSGYRKGHQIHKNKIENLLNDRYSSLPSVLTKPFSNTGVLAELIYWIIQGLRPKNLEGEVRNHLDNFLTIFSSNNLFNNPFCPDTFDGDNRGCQTLREAFDFDLLDPELLIDYISGYGEPLITDSKGSRMIDKFTRLQNRLYEEVFYIDRLRAAEAMFTRSVECIYQPGFTTLDDDMLITKIKKNITSAHIWEQLKSKYLFKPLSVLDANELHRALASFPGIRGSGDKFKKSKKNIEEMLARRLNIQQEFVILYRFEPLDWNPYNLFFGAPKSRSVHKNLLEIKIKESHGKPQIFREGKIKKNEEDYKKFIDVYIPPNP